MKVINANIIDYRVASDSPFIGLLIPVPWDLKDKMRKLLLDNQLHADLLEATTHKMNQQSKEIKKLKELIETRARWDKQQTKVIVDYHDKLAKLEDWGKRNSLNHAMEFWEILK